MCGEGSFSFGIPFLTGNIAPMSPQILDGFDGDKSCAASNFQTAFAEYEQSLGFRLEAYDRSTMWDSFGLTFFNGIMQSMPSVDDHPFSLRPLVPIGDLATQDYRVEYGNFCGFCRATGLNNTSGVCV